MTTKEQTYESDNKDVIAQIRRQIESLVMPNLSILAAVRRERIQNLRAEDNSLEIAQEREITKAFAAATRLFTPEIAIDEIDIPRAAPYLALPPSGEQRNEG